MLSYYILAIAQAQLDASTPHPLPDFDALWDYGNPAATEEKFRQLLPLAHASGDLSCLLQLQTQIARSLGLQRKFAEAHATLDEIEKCLTPQVPVARIRYLLERGRAFNSANDPGRAKPLFLAAWELATSERASRYAIDAAHMLAIAETDLDAQLDWNLKALAAAQSDPAQQGWLYSILNNLGETYRARGEYHKALECFETLAQWFRDRGKHVDVYTLKDIARMNRLLGRPDVALRIIEPIANDAISKANLDGFIASEYGQSLAAAGRTEEARPFLRQAFHLLSHDDYMQRYEPQELQRLKHLAAID